ncbi:MAG: hypothetical protein KatS3mg101_0968 [Patescibacteria group bacterium]|nr:MAG: hypothetical protein KatS3mg101_0968 [Patescibacteria group bacterium]
MSFDGLNDKWIARLKKLGDVVFSSHGNVETFHKQLDLACETKDEKVLFCEDDYLWRPNTISLLDRALDKFQIVSPYDHPGHYREERFNYPKKMVELDGVVYREAPSNTLTFACRTNIIKENLLVIKSFGIRDHELFTELRKRGYEMFVPVYSFATHLVEGLLAPNVDWKL